VNRVDQHQVAHLTPARDIAEKPTALDVPSHYTPMLRTAIGFSYIRERGPRRPLLGRKLEVENRSSAATTAATAPPSSRSTTWSRWRSGCGRPGPARASITLPRFINHLIDDQVELHSYVEEETGDGTFSTQQIAECRQ
jgi:hypothetical protein